MPRLVVLVAFACTTGCVSEAPWGHGTEALPVPASRRVNIGVTRDGFEPKRVEVGNGESVTLVFTRHVEHTCAKKVIVLLDDHDEVARELPINQPVPITVRFDGRGELGYTCGMKMLGGTIVVR